ncbi:MAG: head-tail connector protein [Pseudomonadota bacterium]
MLRETAPPSASAEVLAELARHMRLAPDFASEQSAELADVFAGAVAHIEATLGLCIAPRGFTWRACFNDDGRTQPPMSPIRALTSATDPVDGGAAPLEDFALDTAETRTVIEAPKWRGRQVDLAFDAGFGADWSETPSDLRQAVKMLAAHYYDQRHTAGGDARETLYGVASLIQRWRPMRLTLGAGA